MYSIACARPLHARKDANKRIYLDSRPNFAPRHECNNKGWPMAATMRARTKGVARLGKGLARVRLVEDRGDTMVR